MKKFIKRALSAPFILAGSILIAVGLAIRVGLSGLDTLTTRLDRAYTVLKQEGKNQ